MVRVIGTLMWFHPKKIKTFYLFHIIMPMLFSCRYNDIKLFKDSSSHGHPFRQEPSSYLISVMENVRFILISTIADSVSGFKIVSLQKNINLLLI